jgi:hypothetical protein
MTDPLRGLPPAEGRADEQAMSGSVRLTRGRVRAEGIEERRRAAADVFVDGSSSGPRSAFAMLRSSETLQRKTLDPIPVRQ